MLYFIPMLEISLNIFNMFAWQKWPEAEFYIVPNAGHSAREDGTRSLLIAAADKYKTL